MKLLPVPDVRQDTVYTCGPSSLQAVFGYYGEEHFEKDLAELCGSDPENGTNPRDLVRVARQLGFQAELKDRLTLQDLEKAVDQDIPVIVAAQAWRDEEDKNKPWSQIWNSGHYMVVIGMDEKNVYFEDPSIFASKGVMERKEFLERWHDVDDRPYEQSGIFIKGKPPSPPPTFIHVD